MKKIKELIQVGKPSIVNKNSSHEDVNVESSSFYQISDGTRQSLRNPQADLETIESIDPLYFDCGADVNIHELKNLAVDYKLKDVESRQKKLRSQLNAVSKKLSDVILENQPSYTKELKEVQELQRSLHKAFVICSNGRRFLLSVSVRSTTASLALLHHHQNRQKLRSLFASLQTIKTLQHTDVRLREMLEEEDYDGAIQLCLECLKAASTYKHYNCIKDLSSKLQDTLDLMEEQIDVTLSKSCSAFDENLYTKLHLAYQMLGKTQSAIDQLLMHYTTCIHNTAFHIVLGYAKLQNAEENMQKKQYKDLCEVTSEDIYIPCLMDLCKALWSIMNCYHKTSKWHAQQFSTRCSVTDSEVIEYVNRKLSHGRHRVWADVQSRVRTFISSSDLSSFKYDDFITILDIVKRFIAIGDDFCRGESSDSETQKVGDNLNEPLRKQTLCYFRAHHASRMEELLMFLENEAWHPCPLRSSFNVLEMQEFKFLQQLDDVSLGTGVERKMTEASVVSSKYFDLYSCSEDKHPFEDLVQEGLIKESSSSVSFHYDDYEASEDEDDELHRDYVDEKTGESPVASGPNKSRSTMSLYEGPIMTNTALHVLRLCGSYMKMCDVLKPISTDVLVCMCQLFDLYYYSVYQFFSTSKERFNPKTRRLESTIKHIQETLFQPERSYVDDEEGQNPPALQTDVERGKIRRPIASPLVNLDDEDNFFGISERIVATESLVCLSEQFEILHKQLKQMIPSSKKAFLDQFFSQTVRSSSDVRFPVYLSVATYAFDVEDVVEGMSMVNWDIHEIMSQHNPYVDRLLDHLAHFKTRVTGCVSTVNFPDPVLRVIWDHCIVLSNYSFVEGFSNVRKCSNEGRALMQLDYQQFLMKLEKLTNIRPIPHREYVESYIKAYYLTESDLERWIEEHDEYNHKHLSALLNSSAATHSISSGSSNRNTKQRMLSLIEDLKSRR